MSHDLSHLLATFGAGQIATVVSIAVILICVLTIKICWRRSSSPWDA